MYFYEILKSIMNEKNLSIPDVARLSGLPDSTIRSMLTRKNKTVALEVAFKLSRGLNVSLEQLNGEDAFISVNDTKENEEKLFIKKYNELDDYGRESVNLILEREAQRVAQISRLTEYAKRFSELKNELPNSNDDTPKIRTIPYYDKLASAGTGQILWDDLVEFDMEIIDNEKTRHGDFALGVNGDSMEPIYWNTDTVLVQKTQDLQ